LALAGAAEPRGGGGRVGLPALASVETLCLVREVEEEEEEEEEINSREVRWQISIIYINTFYGFLLMDSLTLSR